MQVPLLLTNCDWQFLSWAERQQTPGQRWAAAEGAAPEQGGSGRSCGRSCGAALLASSLDPTPGGQLTLAPAAAACCATSSSCLLATLPLRACTATARRAAGAERRPAARRATAVPAASELRDAVAACIAPARCAARKKAAGRGEPGWHPR